MIDLAPPTMHSPISPYQQQSKHSFTTQQTYLASPQPETSSMTQSTHGLGIYECSIPQQQQQTPVHDLPPSPQPSDSWSHSSMMEQEYPQTSQQAPDISSAAFDPFSGYYNHGQAHMLPSSSPEAPGLVYCQTPPSTNMPSHRNSVSSGYSPSETYDESQFYTSKVKMENGEEWYPTPDNEHVLQRTLTTQGLSSYSTGVSPITGPTDDPYMSKQAHGAYPIEFSNMPGEESRSKFDGGAPTLPSVNRIKKKRQRTTPEEATHECRVCGKLFKRSYNWKSHMETHNPERKYPHPCTAMVGHQPCTKKFQRKTDLDRHYDSVHLKARNHRCNLCGNRFARRDTLRRHTEDGCPKRFELGFRESSAAPTNVAVANSTPARWTLNNLPQPVLPQQRSFSLGGAIPIPRPSSTMAPPMSTGPHPHPFASFDRPSFVSSPIQTSSVFAS